MIEIKPETAWEGKIGSVPLRVDVPHQGRIEAEWGTGKDVRQKVSRSLEEFERSVVFQVMIKGGVTDAALGREVLEAVAKAEAERPRPAAEPRVVRRKNPKARQHRRSRRAPRRR